MRLVPIIASIALSALAIPVSHAAREQPGAAQSQTLKKDYLKRHGLQIRVQEGGWGTADAKEIETVLYSTATELLERFPGKRLNSIVVTHTDKNPVVLYERGPNDEYRVYLTAKGRRWPVYAYEFAHELSHILTNYQHHTYPNATTYNQWFEETLCEVASLYTLKRLAVTWEIAPPHPQWAVYAPDFQAFAEEFLQEKHRKLPSTTNLANWFQQNQNDMKRNPYLRGHNEVVANLLLPLFEENPEIWEAITYLNMDLKGNTFKGYMQSWHDNVPEEFKDIIRHMMVSFGMLKSGDAAETIASDPSEGRQPGAAGRAAQ